MADRILVLAEHEEGALRERTWELLGMAHVLGGEAGKEVGAVLLGSGVKELAERYETPLPQLTNRVAELETKVNRHLERMGFAWN